MLYKNRIFQCMGKIFCVEFQRYPLKFHSKYLTHTLKDVHFIHRSSAVNGLAIMTSSKETFSTLLTLCGGNSAPEKKTVWVNNREARDLRRHRAHYDVTVMRSICDEPLSEPMMTELHDDIYGIITWAHSIELIIFPVDITCRECAWLITLPHSYLEPSHLRLTDNESPL